MAATSRRRRCACSEMPTAPMARTSISSSTAAAGTTRTNSPTPSSAARASPMASTAARRDRRRCWRMCWRASMSPIRISNSIELGVTTVDHYFDTLGGISRAVRRARGAAARRLYRRPDPRRRHGAHAGRAGRARDPHPRAQSEMVRGAAVARLRRRAADRGPCHQHDGLVRDHRRGRRLGSISSSPRPSCSTTAMRKRLAALNPMASAKIANRLIEAHERKYWSPDPSTLDALRRAGDELEDRMEGIGVGVAA